MSVYIEQDSLQAKPCTGKGCKTCLPSDPEKCLDCIDWTSGIYLYDDQSFSCIDCTDPLNESDERCMYYFPIQIYEVQEAGVNDFKLEDRFFKFRFKNTEESDKIYNLIDFSNYGQSLLKYMRFHLLDFDPRKEKDRVVPKSQRKYLAVSDLDIDQASQNQGEKAYMINFHPDQIIDLKYTYVELEYVPKCSNLVILE